MTQEEMDNNAYMVRDQLLAYGWTIEAICGVLGNMRAESFINPAQTQIGYKIGGTEGGFGLVQWTPQTNYTDWAKNNNHDVNSGFWQVWCVDTLANVPTQWIPTSAFNMSYTEFKHSTLDCETLAEAFFRNYERGTASTIPNRKAYAEYYWELFGGQPTPPTPPEPPDPPKPDPRPYKRAGRLPVWMKIRYNI